MRAKKEGKKTTSAVLMQVGTEQAQLCLTLFSNCNRNLRVSTQNQPEKVKTNKIVNNKKQQ